MEIESDEDSDEAMLIGDLIQRRARISPEQVFWEQGGDTWNYARTEGDANRVAHALWAEGLQPGDHAAICAGNGYPYVCAHYGAAKAGLVLAHLNARYTAGELSDLCAHSDARLLLFGPEQLERVARARKDLPLVRRYVCLSAEPEAAQLPPWAVSWGAWCGSHPDTILTALRPSIEAGAPFQLLYTSGTTGAPKGALISHRAKLRQGVTHALNLGLLAGERVLSALPLYHQYAQWLLLVTVPVAGARVVAHGDFSPRAFWHALRREGIAHLPAVPTMLYRLLDEAPREEDAARAPNLRCIVYGGAPIDPGRIPALRGRFPGVRLFQGFGQTEAGYCLGLHDGDHDRHPESLGRPDLFSEVRLLDGAGREVPDGEPGEIVTRSPYLMNGYYKDAQATEEYFAFGREFGRTGDLAVRDAGGLYYIAGRKSDLVISGGVNLYPAEVERALLSHPAVAEAAAFGVPHDDWGEAMAAAVIPRQGVSVAPQALDAHCREVLAGFKCPRKYFFPSEFPRTHNGKVQKFALRESLLQAP